MLTRRTFFEHLSSLPLVGGLVGGTAATAAAAAPVRRDYFKELGVRPFINAAGTYTDMTASLMPPEVMDAINYASKNFVFLNDLHDKVGARIAELVKAEAAMVSCGAASAMTLGTAGGAHRRRPEEDRRPAEPRGHEERGDHAEVAPLRLRPCGAQLRRDDRRGRDRGRTRGGDHAPDGDDALLQQQQLGRPDSRRGVRPPRQEARRRRR